MSVAESGILARGISAWWSSSCAELKTCLLPASIRERSEKPEREDSPLRRSNFSRNKSALLSPITLDGVLG